MANIRMHQEIATSMIVSVTMLKRVNQEIPCIEAFVQLIIYNTAQEYLALDDIQTFS